jgi:hypothetical protein
MSWPTETPVGVPLPPVCIMHMYIYVLESPVNILIPQERVEDCCILQQIHYSQDIRTHIPSSLYVFIFGRGCPSFGGGEQSTVNYRPSQFCFGNCFFFQSPQVRPIWGPIYNVYSNFVSEQYVRNDKGINRQVWNPSRSQLRFLFNDSR